MTVTLSPLAGAGWQFFDNNGVPLAGGLLYTYAAGTSTPLAAYTTITGTIAHSNPIVLDSAGRVPYEIWITLGLGYKFVLKDSSANLIATWDNIPSNAESPFANDASGIAYEQGYTVNAGSFIVGNQYMITFVGTTDFVSIGAATNTVGVHFTATGVGSGTGTAKLSQSVQTKLQESVSVKDFGAKGDGVTNDTDAFLAASAYITAQDGGKLIVPAGTYIVGKQTFAGATGKGYAYKGSDVIVIENCTNPVVIEFQGAKLKLANGLKFGSFNPVTGAAYYPPSLPFVNYDYQASLGRMLTLYNNANVSVVGSSEFDGNIANVTLGGQWGDTGYQIVAYGIWAYNNNLCRIENAYSHHHSLDGMASGYDGITTEGGVAYPFTVINSAFTNNARQGWSVTGGRGITAINCKFNNTAKDIPFASSPAAGCDLEAEGGWIRDVLFLDCEFSNNGGAGLVADSGNTAGVTCIRCKFIGTTSASVWPLKPRFAFYDCLIVGTAFNAYYSATDPGAATKFFNCKFSDQSIYSPTGTVYDGGYLANFEGGANVVLENCEFFATNTRNLLIKNGGYVRNCTFVCQAPLTNKDYVAIIWSSTIENLTILDQIATPAADGYYVNFSGTKYKGTNYISGTKIKWWSWSAGAGGASGYLGQSDPSQVAYPYLSVIKGAGATLLGYYGTADTYWGTAAPTTGTFNQGDRFFNSAATVGNPKSWVCTVAGTPGTWVSEGNL
jgi:hypothetical protein